MEYPIEYLLFLRLIKPYIRKIEGLENLPKNKPFIAAANHSSYMDIVIVPYVIFFSTRRMFRGFYNSRYRKNSVIRMILDRYKEIPVAVKKDIKDKKTREKINKEAFEMAQKALKSGHNIIIFPEGTRSLTGKIQKGKIGVAKIALLSKIPIVPVGIKGSHNILPKGSIFPRFKRAEVQIGKPIHLNKYYNKKITKKLLRNITDNIMKEIARLSG